MTFSLFHQHLSFHVSLLFFNFSDDNLVRKADGSGILKEFVKNSYHIKYRIDDFILFVFKRSLNTEDKT